MKRNTFVAGVVAGCAAVVFLMMPGLAGQAPKAPPHAATAKAAPQADMAAQCQAMMAEHEKMMADVKAADQRLDDLVAKMSAASSATKADATAAVVTEMVTQRRTMRDGMMTMQQGMMSHMMEHMQSGKDSMAKCPMMKSMAGMKHE